MMATSTATLIEIELQPRSAAQPHQAVTGNDSHSDLDPVLQASQLNDSTVPDGGYGWVVVAGCAIVSWWMIGTPYSWGIMQGALAEEGVSSPAVLSFVGSLAVALISALAVANSVIIRRMGSQKTCMVGIALMSLSEFVSSFTFRNVGGLFATSGVMMGLGISLGFATLSTAPAQWFSRKRGLANGIVFAGGGFGGAVISFAIDALLTRLGPAWTFRCLALMTLATGLPAAYLVKERVPYGRSSIVEWRLFKSFTFVVIFLAGALGTFPLFVPPFFLPLYAKSLGLSSGTGAGLVAGFNFSSAVGRIGCGLLCDVLGALNTLLLSLVISGLSMLALWPASTTLGPMIAFVILNGISNGGFFSTMPTVVGNVFGSARVSTAMGMIVTGWMGGYLMGAPIAGYILDAYGGSDNDLKAYRPAMYYAGSLALAAAGLIASVVFRIRQNISGTPLVDLANGKAYVKSASSKSKLQMHLLSNVLWLQAAFLYALGQTALTCRLEGPVLPKPSSLHKSCVFQAAAANLTAIFDGALAGSIKSEWPVQNLSFSVGLVSFDQEEPAAPIWEYHRLADGNTRGTQHIDKDAQYLIGSITKVMSAYALLKSGVDMDAPVTEFVPELANASSRIHWEDVSLRMLASHLSGAPTNYGFSEHYYLKDVFRQYGFPPITDEAYPPCGVPVLNGACSEQAVLDGMTNVYPQGAPMGHPAYSNIAFTILSIAIEKATGKNYSQTIDEFVAKPLGLKSTFLSPGDDDRAVIPPGDNSWGSDFGVNAPGGGLVSTLSDLSTFSHAILSRTINLTDTEVRSWLKPDTFAGNSHTLVGMPWEIWRAENLAPQNPHPITVYGKSGSALAYRNQLNLIDEYGIGIIGLTAGAAEPLTDIMNAALAILVPAVDAASRTEAEKNYARAFKSKKNDENSTEVEAEFELDADSLLLTLLRRNGTDILNATTNIWNLIMGDFTNPVSSTVRLFPQGVTQQVEIQGQPVTQEVWRLWPDQLPASQAELPGRNIDADNCLGWTIGDWVHYGGEPMDRVTFYKDENQAVIAFEAPFLRSGLLYPA
ncbi:Beta-lactamase-like protein [Paramyrothecium foliicola]|nr:Beta-lactamase-like protein [Paramyrothecium foliicola]